MKRLFWIGLLGFGLIFLSTSQASAQDKVVVIPLLGNGATGDAAEADVLESRTFSNDSGTGLKGTMPDIGSQDITPGTTAKEILEGYHDGTGEVQGDSNLVSGNIRSDATIFNVAGDTNVVNTSTGTAVAEDILSGKKAWVAGSEVTGSLICPPAPTGDAVAGDVLSGKGFSNASGAGLTGTMTNQGARNYTPGVSNQTIDAGYYNGSGHVVGDANLTPGNIKAGAEIFGVTGTFPSDGTATTDQVKTGSTFYTTNATKLTGDGTKTLTPANDTVTAGYYEGTTLSAVDADLSAENIKKDATIFGVTGDDNVVNTSTGDAEAGEIANGKIAWVDGVEVTGTGTIATFPYPVPRTGQTSTVPLNPATYGSDGDLQKGVIWPNPRFTDNSDGTVTDNLTGLTWLKNANCTDTVGGVANPGALIWNSALTWCNSLADGQCGLSDSSSAGDWRLPNKNELASLVDVRYYTPALSNAAGTGQWLAEDAFSSVQSNGYYFSSTTAAYNSSGKAWGVYLNNGTVGVVDKVTAHYVWPVRD